MNAAERKFRRELCRYLYLKVKKLDDEDKGAVYITMPSYCGETNIYILTEYGKKLLDLKIKEDCGGKLK